MFKGRWQACEILDVCFDGKACAVRYDSGDEEGDVDIASRVRDIPVRMKLEKGQQVEVLFEGSWYESEVLDVSEDGMTCSTMQESDIDVDQRVRAPRIPLNELETGQRLKGSVVRVEEFGIFVDVGATVSGFVHTSRMPDEAGWSPKDHVRRGQQVDVWVVEASRSKLALSMLQDRLSWEDTPSRSKPQDYSAFVGVDPDEWLNGTVHKVAPFGLLVAVQSPDGTAAAVGLVHYSLIRSGFVESGFGEAEVGQKVKVRVLSVDPSAHKMALDMVESSDRVSPLEPFADVTPMEWLPGVVVSIVDYGIFVSVTTPDGKSKAEGLVHISQIRDGFVAACADEVDIGQKVEVRVAFVDVEAGKLALSMVSPTEERDWLPPPRSMAKSQRQPVDEGEVMFEGPP